MDADGRIEYWNDRATDLFGYSAAEMIGQSPAALYAEPTGPDRLGPQLGAAFDADWLARRKDGTTVWTWTRAHPVRSADGTIVGGLVISTDISDWKQVQIEHDRLALAVAQSAESVVITDRAGTILYVNPAFERTTGYSAVEVLGQNPRILRSGDTPANVYTAMWATLAARRSWYGELVNRRKDGSRLVEEVSITPLLDHSGEIVQYVGVKRDVTAARDLENRLNRGAADQSVVSSIIAGLSAGPTPEATSEAVTDRLLALPDVAYSAIVLFQTRDDVRVLAALGSDRLRAEPRAAGDRTARERARIRRLRQRVKDGPFVERWSRDDESPMAATFERLQIRALACAPIHVDGAAIGFVQIGAVGANAGRDLERLLPTLSAFGVLASMLLAPQLGAEAKAATDAAVYERLISSRAYRPVFQPIVSLATGAVVGYEGLTRFRDGTPPDEQFANAAAAGLGAELELATLESCLEAAAALPPHGWLDLNVSCEVLRDPDRLAYLLWRHARRPIVLEITEHERIADYDLLRAKIAALGIPVRLAVDDAGSGFSSMRHILELQPDLIKLDRSLVAGIDSDPVRQGLVAGLRHFAVASGALVVAEGIETVGELQTLRGLQIELGQGYLLGRATGAAAAGRVDLSPLFAATTAGGPGPDAIHRVKAILWEADGADERMTFVSNGAVDLTGHSAATWMTEPAFWETHLHPDDRERAVGAMADAIRVHGSVSLEYRFRTADGRYRWYEDLVEVIPVPGAHDRVVGVMIDVTDRHELEEALAWQGLHDPLTHALNRQGFEQLFQNRGSGPDRWAGVIFLDLDAFKAINDRAGHAVGDEVLAATADRLRDSLREGDLLARFGGDEFVVGLSAGSRRALRQVADRLVAAASVPFASGDRIVQVSISAGLAILGHAEPMDLAIRRADRALYEAKRRGGHCAVADAALAEERPTVGDEPAGPAGGHEWRQIIDRPSLELGSAG